jgi:6-phosphogluconolactonase
MTKIFRAQLTLSLVLASMWMAGCGHYTCGATFGGGSTCTPSGGGPGTGGGGGGGGKGSGPTAFFYFLDGLGVNMGEDTLSAGTFTNISSFVAPPLPAGPLTVGGSVAVNKKFIYIPFSNNTVFGYSVGSTGVLTSVPNSPYTASGGASASSDPAGHFLFVSDFNSGVITVFAVNTNDGSLTQVVGSPFPSGLSRVAMTAADGQGKFLFATEGTGGAAVAAFTINQLTGALSPVTGSPFAFNMSEVMGETSGKFLLGITGQTDFNSSVGDKHIYVFSIASTGAIAAVAGSPFATTSSPLNFTVHPSGAWVYTFNEDVLGGPDPIEGYQIGTSGALTALSTSPFATLKALDGQFEQTGQELFAIGVLSSTGIVTPYSTDTTTGALTDTLQPLGYPNSGFALTDAP